MTTLAAVRVEVLVGMLLSYLCAAAVWPPPQSLALRGDPIPLSAEFRAALPHALGDMTNRSSGSSRLLRAIDRFNLLLAPQRRLAVETAVDRESALRRVDVVVANMDGESLSMRTNYSYRLRVLGSHSATITAPSIYGAMYGLETLAQLIDIDRGVVVASSVDVVDAPDYAWRGLLIDAGRRFAPVPLLENIITTMAAVKLNVLHLHVTDFCRFGVESLRFPNLTAGLGPLTSSGAANPLSGYYTQKDIKALIAFAADRGVRVVPEFEMPGHALGFLPIASAGGLEFCATCAYGPTGDGSKNTCKPSQLWGTNGTVRVLKAVLGEMVELFTDEVFHIGADETFVKSGAGERCTEDGTTFVEKEIVNAVTDDFGKTPAGWEQVLFKTGAATNETIVYAYMSGAGEVTARGRRAVVSNGTTLYFTTAAPGGPSGWSKLWYDIGFDVPNEGPEKSLLLGGEMSMWTDTYCSPRECGAMPAYHVEKGGALFNRTHDAAYSQSLGGMIWPRGFVGAAAFWNFNGSSDASSGAFVSAIWELNDRLTARGALLCPTNCSCDQMTACGKPYLR